MAGSKLYGKSRTELLYLAEKMGVVGVRRMPNLQLIHSIQVAEIKKRKGHIRLPQKAIRFRALDKVSDALLGNPTNETKRLRLELVDPNRVFSIPTDQTKLSVEPGQTVRVPVSFAVDPKGDLMTLSREYRGGLRIWDLDSEVQIDDIALSGTGPGYRSLEDRGCTKGVLPCWPSPPGTLIEVDPDPPVVWPGETVHVHWEAELADQVLMRESRVDWDVLPDGTFPDAMARTEWVTVPTTGDRHVRVWGNWRSEFWFNFSDEPPSPPAIVYVHTKVRVGYHNAAIQSMVHEGDLRRIRGYLEEIESRISPPSGGDGCIRRNLNLDRFGDPYLRGDLTDDILDKMKDVFILLSGHYMSPFYAYASEYRSTCPPGVHGITPPSRAFIELCEENGGSAGSLLHELYHYAANHDWGNEIKAHAICTGPGGCFEHG